MRIDVYWCVFYDHRDLTHPLHIDFGSAHWIWLNKLAPTVHIGSTSSCLLHLGTAVLAWHIYGCTTPTEAWDCLKEPLYSLDGSHHNWKHEIVRSEARKVQHADREGSIVAMLWNMPPCRAFVLGLYFNSHFVIHNFSTGRIAPSNRKVLRTLLIFRKATLDSTELLLGGG